MRRHIKIYPKDNCNQLRTLPRSSNRFSFKEATVEDMELIINNLDTKKYTGYDRISPKLVVKFKDKIKLSFRILSPNV